jgi:hypothetical protein
MQLGLPAQQLMPLQQQAAFDPFAGFDDAQPSNHYNNINDYPGVHSMLECLAFEYVVHKVSAMPSFTAQFRVVQSDTLAPGTIVDWAVFCGAGLRTEDMVNAYFRGPTKALIAAMLCKHVNDVKSPDLQAALQGSVVGKHVGFRVVPSFNKKTGQPRMSKEGKQYNDVLPFAAAQQAPAPVAPQPQQLPPGFDGPVFD